jgi:hypothetical protein
LIRASREYWLDVEAETDAALSKLDNFQPATLVCCTHESEGSPFVCSAHKKGHVCSDTMFLPVVNSLRVGVCGARIDAGWACLGNT